MTNSRTPLVVILLTIPALAVWSWATTRTAVAPDGREEVVFWHFWGGRDRAVVEGRRKPRIRRFDKKRRKDAA